MRDDHALGAGGGDGALQPRPVGVVAEHEAAVHALAPACAAQLHPAAGERVAVRAQAPAPGAAQHCRRRHHQGLAQVVGVAQGLQRHGLGQRDTGVAVGAVQRLHRAVHDDAADGRVDTGDQPLRLAEAVAQQQAGTAGSGVGAPPGVHLGQHLGLRTPAVDRQAEGAFGDEAVATHRLEGVAGGVGVAGDAAGEVVPRGHPDAAGVFDAHLRRAQHVAGRVQAERDAVPAHRLAVGQRLQRDVAQPRAQHAGAGRAGEIGAVAAPRVVGMGVRDDGARHRPPGVDEEVARRAVQAFGAQDHEIVGRRGRHGHRRRHRSVYHRLPCCPLVRGRLPAPAPARCATWRRPACCARRPGRYGRWNWRCKPSTGATTPEKPRPPASC